MQDRVISPHQIGSFVNSLFTVLQIFRGLLFFSASGSRASDQLWKARGLTQRLIPSAPTEVKRLSVEAGNGPPCCMDKATRTPVGTAFRISRPQISLTASISSGLSIRSLSEAIIEVVSCPSI